MCVYLYWVVRGEKSKSTLRMSTTSSSPSFTNSKKTEIQVDSKILARVCCDYSEDTMKEKRDSNLMGLLKESHGMPALSSLHAFRTISRTDGQFLRQCLFKFVLTHDFYEV